MTNPKVEHVRRSRQSRNHECHWPGCERQVPPAMWGCKAHWFKLPKRLRDAIWDEYVPGQEARMDPSDGYLTVAREVQDWIRAKYPEEGAGRAGLRQSDPSPSGLDCDEPTAKVGPDQPASTGGA